MYNKPSPFYLDKLAHTLSQLKPGELLDDLMTPYTDHKKRFPIIGDEARNFIVKNSGWQAPTNYSGNSWGDAASGYGAASAAEIEFDIKVTDLHWRVRGFYREGQFVGLQYEAEPWERVFIVGGQAVYDKGFYTWGESFYQKLGGLRDDAIESLYSSAPPVWWLMMHPDHPWFEIDRKRIVKSRA